MKQIWNWIQIVLTAIGGYIGFFVGGLDGLMYAIIAMVIADYITGVMLAIIDKKLSSDIGFRGIFKKVLIFVMIGIANIVDVYLIKNGSAIRTAVLFFYISNEGISILENVSRIGLPIPDKLKNVLEQLSTKEEDK